MAGWGMTCVIFSASQAHPVGSGRFWRAVLPDDLACRDKSIVRVIADGQRKSDLKSGLVRGKLQRMEKARMSRSLELPEAVYADLVRAAEASGKTPAGWIQERLTKNGAIGNGTDASDGELAAADAALDACLVSLGQALGADNEQIDAELAREYGDDHADLYRPSESK